MVYGYACFVLLEEKHPQMFDLWNALEMFVWYLNEIKFFTVNAIRQNSKRDHYFVSGLR